MYCSLAATREAMALHLLQTRASLSRDVIPPCHWRMSFQEPRGYIGRPLQLILPRGQSSRHYCDFSEDRRSRSCSSYGAGADSVCCSRASRAELPAFPSYKLKGDWKALAALGPRAVVNCLTASPHCQISQLYQDFGAMGLVLGGAFLWVKVFGYLAKQDLVERKLSRKLVHISSGLLYLASWPLFSFSPWARFVAALVPLVNIVRFLIAGLGLRESEALVSSMSREGDPKELLRGPFYYVIVLMLSAILFWRDSPVGMISLAMMCGGDGVADIVGRKYGGLKLPYNAEKSWAGSVAMCTLGFWVSLGFLYYFSALGFFDLDVVQAVPRVALIALAATVVESLPLSSKYDDNITVPLTTVLLGVVLFSSMPGALAN